MSIETFEQQKMTEAPRRESRLMPSLSELSVFQRSSSGGFSISAREEAVFGKGFMFDMAGDIYGQKKTTIAQDVQLTLPYQLEPSLNRAAIDSFGTVAKVAADEVTQRRALDEVNRIQQRTWSEAYKAFPELQSYLSERQATALMKAIIANEIEHYDPVDVAQDAAARLGHALPDKTIGVAQLSPKAVREREIEFPKQLDKIKNKEVQTLEEPTKVPLLVAATLAHYVKQFSNYGYPINQETLGYAYNPDLKTVSGHKDIMPTIHRLQTSEHACNITRWLSVVGG